MQYWLIRIKHKNIRTKKEDWELTYFLDETDRIDSKTFPSSEGFYYLPKRKSLQKGVKDLQKHLIKRHEEEIKRLQKSLSKLVELDVLIQETSS